MDGGISIIPILVSILTTILGILGGLRGGKFCIVLDSSTLEMRVEWLIRELSGSSLSGSSQSF